MTTLTLSALQVFSLGVCVGLIVEFAALILAGAIYSLRRHK